MLPLPYCGECFLCLCGTLPVADFLGAQKLDRWLSKEGLWYPRGLPQLATGLSVFRHCLALEVFTMLQKF